MRHDRCTDAEIGGRSGEDGCIGSSNGARSVNRAGLANCAGPANCAGSANCAGEAGLTLMELIIVVTMLAILSTAALPVAKFEVKRTKERELRQDLWEMRRAIDAYKDVADMGLIQTKADSNNYPPDLQTLVDGVQVKDKKLRFLRSIPVDPMTNSTDWGLRSNQDDPDSTSFGGQDVYDVYTTSQGTGLDGTKYDTW